MSPRPAVRDSHAASQALKRAAGEHTESREWLSLSPWQTLTTVQGVEASRAGCGPALPASPSLGTPSERQCGVVATQRPGDPPAPNQRSRPPPLDAPLFCLRHAACRPHHLLSAGPCLGGDRSVWERGSQEAVTPAVPTRREGFRDFGD